MEKEESIVVARQAPLRRRYRAEPGEAITVKRVRSAGGPSPLHGTVTPVGFEDCAWPFGIDAKVGGFDDLPNPGHLLCAALTACLDSTVRMLADALGVTLLHLRVDTSGHVDVRGCLAMTDAVRAGFERIQCAVELEIDPASDPRKAALLAQQAERLCVTLDTLREGVPVDVTFEPLDRDPPRPRS